MVFPNRDMMNLRTHDAYPVAAGAGMHPRYGATVDARLPSEQRAHTSGPTVRVELDPQTWDAMRLAGAEVFARLTAGRALGVAMGIDGAVEALGERAPWACWLLAARQRLAEVPAGSAGQLVLPDDAASADEPLLAQVTGLWRLLGVPTPMGDDAGGWSFLLARWQIAPLLPPSRTATVDDWFRVLRGGGECRRSARTQARMAVADALETEHRAGMCLWVELCRSQFMHPMQVMSVGNIIRGETEAALRRL
jgi:hypothetical protein